MAKTQTRRVKKQVFNEKLYKYSLGTKENPGALTQFATYGLLICVAFIFLYPLLYMIATSFMSLDDLLDVSVRWIPNQLDLVNYKKAWKVLDYPTVFPQTLLITILPSLIQTFICSVVAYGFARYKFKGKGFFLALLILTYVIPPQITMMPRYRLMSQLGLLGSLHAFLLPAVLGQGLYSALFILILMQFYKQIPGALIEAARIDGAGHFRTYFQIAVPSAVGAHIVVFLFSVVWYWNETYLTNLYLRGSSAGRSLTTLMLKLNQFTTDYEAIYPAVESQANRLNEALEMAGTILCILPLLIVYFVMQRYFVESIDQAGITGE